MVIFTDWFMSPVIPRSACGLPMTGEDTGLEAVASPMVGYLGKVQERAASLDHCPWCHSKGQTYPLRSYHINLEESITLCTNSQCLFPLVSRPLEDVLASLVPVELSTVNKRKSPQTLVANEPSTPSPKRLRLKELECSESQTSAFNDGDVHNTVDTCNGPPLDVEEHVDAHLFLEIKHLELQKVCTDAQKFSLDKVDGIETLQTFDSEEELMSKHCLNGEDHCSANAVNLDRSGSSPDGDVSPVPVQTESMGTIEPMLPVESTFADSNSEVPHSEAEGMSFTETNSEEELVPSPVEIFWRNGDNLCWLDSLLVALVNLRSLKNSKPKDEPEESPVRTLLAGYDEAHANIKTQQHTDKDGSLKVPCHLLHKINSDLESLRMSFFNLLQPKLHCKLGQKETPVFALPLLVKLDPWLESLFQSTFYWDFKCSECKRKTKENVVKSLPTFTNIVPDWHPLKAVHLAPCNNCLKNNQRRRMVLKGVPPVFALHFVEGLHDNNIQVYNFCFKKKHYSVSTIIQYNSQLRHFITWVHKSDGSWMEFDDLKHPDCKLHKTFPVPAQEIHIVFWEEEQRQESRACSPSSTFTESPPSSKNINPSAKDLDIITDDSLQCSPDQSLISPQKNFEIMDGIFEQNSTVTAGVDTTIGSTTLLDTFEGLTHDDIVTLTLVEVKEDSKKPPSNSTDGEIEQAKDVKSPNVNNKMQNSFTDISAPAPDSSSTGEAIENPEETKGELSGSEPEEPVSEEDNFDDDPTFMLKSRRGKTRRRSVSTNKAKRQKVERPKEKAAKTSQCEPPLPPPPTEKPTSPVSSTVHTPQNAWSYLLERSLGHIQNSCKINSNQKPIVQLTRRKVSAVPQQQRNLTSPKVVPKQQVLRADDSGGLPLKAAEMYGAFGSKNAKPNSTSVNMNKEPLMPPVQKAVTCNTPINTSLNSSITDITFSQTKSSKMPPGLSETDILRYKLLKKLKAKRKKLATLNEMLGQSGDAGFNPDSTNNFSPNTVTSSTLDDEFLSDLLSPATTTTSNLSPDSTDFLEMLASGQEATVGAEMSSNTAVQLHTGEGAADFLDEFMSRAVAERPSEMEEDVLSALDMFL